ncbi:hypothetical protein [Actinomadura formosensis]|uniref:hypothetical protein n=1 Tax=Actinomadura formosensis TaxID=60706 RepID=UPI001041939F|nr:hypothetical protein [Actinomadura formosensis]
MNERHFSDPTTWLQGNDLDPYRVAPDGLCWWCSAPATTREHKFKRTDLTQMWGDSPYLYWSSGNMERLTKINGPKSDVAKFGASLCLNCNGARSQPFDDAYVTYSRYVWRNMDALWRSRYIDMADIFGDSWSVEVPNLAKYFAKHIACRIVDDGFRVPPSVLDFLNGTTDRMPDMHMVLFKNRELRRYRRAGKKLGIEAAGLHTEPAAGDVSRSRKCLTMYSGASLVGFIGMKYRWEDGTTTADPFYAYQMARLHRRDKLPTV